MINTVLGSRGFIGSHLVAALRATGQVCQTPARDADLSGSELGIVYFCIGLTADFRARPYDTVDAHINELRKVLERSRFDRLIYLSSTRVYKRVIGEAEEDSRIAVHTEEPDDLYNISKLMGESLCLSSGRDCAVARLSNVYGPMMNPHSFLASLIESMRVNGRVTLRTSLTSSKDYICVSDVAEALIRIGLGGSQRIYNVACGENVDNRTLCEALCALTGATFDVAELAPTVIFPKLSVARLRQEFQLKANSLLQELPRILQTAPSTEIVSDPD